MSQSNSQANSDVGDSQSVSIGRQNQKRQKRSNAWDHFERKGDGSVVCMHCSKVLSHGPTLETSHLNRYIKDVCKQFNEEARKMFSSGKGGDFSSFKYDSNATRDLMMMLFIDAKIPFSIIESQFWEQTMKSLRPEYRAVGRQTLRNDIVEVFKARKGVSLNEFEELDFHVSFTSDIWTSNVNLGYLCLTAHYIDKRFNLRKKIISFEQIPYPHSGHKIAETIRKAIFQWKLDEKVFTITLDNCSTNNNAMSYLEYMFWDKNVFEGEDMHMRYGAHILNIMVQDGMEIIREALTKIRELMQYITSSGPRLQTFNQILNAMQLSSKRWLTLDCITRWNSTYDMVVETLKYKDALLRYGDGTAVIVPSLEDWNVAVDLEKFLRVFLDATKTFSTFRRPSSHAFLKEVWTIRITLLEDYANPILQKLSKEMLKKFQKYWERPNGILTLACIFDPRHKLEWVDFCFGIVYGADTDLYKERIEFVGKSLKKWYEDYASTTGQVTTNMSPQVECQNEKQKKLEISSGISFSKSSIATKEIRVG